MGLLAGLFNLGEAEALIAPNIIYTSSEQNVLPYVLKSAQKYSVEPALIYAHIFVESAFKPAAQRWEFGQQYSRGLMQLLDSTADSLAGRKLSIQETLDPDTNIDLGTKYIRQNLDRYSGDYPKAIAAYNAGSAKINPKTGKFTNQTYVDKVLRALEGYRSGKTPMRSVMATVERTVTDPTFLMGFGIAGLAIGLTFFSTKK
jgi:soluble lytic murein transglycosylase-like protein